MMPSLQPLCSSIGCLLSLSRTSHRMSYYLANLPTTAAYDLLGVATFHSRQPILPTSWSLDPNLVPSLSMILTVVATAVLIRRANKFQCPGMCSTTSKVSPQLKPNPPTHSATFAPNKSQPFFFQCGPHYPTNSSLQPLPRLVLFSMPSLSNNQTFSLSLDVE